jgi:Caspase domain
MKSGYCLLQALLSVAVVIAACISVSGPVQGSEGGGKLRAVVIGIDDYQHVSPLKGAVADARDIGAALRALGITDLKVLLNADADRVTVLREFGSLVARTEPDDSIVISLAGHGAQEPERIKGSEPDGMDTVFLLSGFDPTDPQRASEKILQSEFMHFTKQFEDKGARVIFVADSCSGGALAREVDARAQGMSYRSVSYTPIADMLQSVATRADAFLSPKDFQRSTFLAASDKQTNVPEIRIQGSGYRGALSYAVARALGGAAGFDNDGQLTAGELISYVQQVAYQLTDGRQQVAALHNGSIDPAKDVLLRFSRGIRVRPAGEAAETIETQGAIQIQDVTLVPVALEVPPTPAAPERVPLPKIKDPVRVASLDGQSSRLSGLTAHAAHVVVKPDANPDLVWDPSTRDVISGGDVIAHDVNRDDLSTIIDRTAAVRWLKLRSAQAPQEMKVFPNDKLHRKGEQVEISIYGVAGRSLVVFNIAGDGTLQLLWPLGSDSPVIEKEKSEHRIPHVAIREPFGADEIVSVSAAQSQTDLGEAIRQLDRGRNPLKASELIERYDGADVRVGLVGLFTAP